MIDFSLLEVLHHISGMISNLVDMLSEFLADGETGLLRQMKIATAEKVPKFTFYGFDWDPVFDKVLYFTFHLIPGSTL